MKKFSKLFAIITMIALLLTSLMPVSVFADDLGSITIKAPDSPSTHTIEGRTFSVYKIFNLTYDGGTAYSYTLAPEFSDLVDYNGCGTEAELVKFLEKANTEELDDFAQYVFDFIDPNGNPPAVSAYSNITADGASVEFNNLPYGYYLVTGSINANGDDEQEVIASCSLTTVTANVNIIPKADAPTIDKQVDHHGTWQEWTDLNIGDTAKFMLTSNVPNMKGYDSYAFIVHDTMSEGLTFDPTSVNVTIGGVGYADFDVVTVTDDPTIAPDTFRIVFDADAFLELRENENSPKVGDDIVITYSALVNENAVIGVTGDPTSGNPNTVYLEYSNDPNWVGTGTPGEKQPTGETPPDEVIVYTFEIDIFKHAEGDTPLADAWFKLKDSSYGTIEVVSIGIDIEGIAVYRLATSENNPADVLTYTGDLANQYIVSPLTTGKIRIEGLDAGTYYLEEIKAPDGYNKFVDDILVEIGSDVTENTEGDPTDITITVTNTVNGVSNTGRINILNNSGTLFPGTGGIGRTIFILVGSTMLAVGLISLVVFRKKIFGTK